MGRLLGRAFLAVLLSCVVMFMAVQVYFYALVLWYAEHPPQRTAFMSHRLGEAREKKPDASLRYQWVDYTKISRNLKRAMIAAEDSKFVEHEGFDWEGIQLAIEKNKSRGRYVAGGSTITQQLAKNLFLSPEKSYLRKGQEAIITLMLEYTLDKERILELYLNVIEWGNGVFGAEAASRRYFGISASQLSADQAARLAAMAPNPRFYERNGNAPGLRKKIGIIVARMPQVELPE
ncbi:MAG: monofunctional biosynthetic peptidoglycan transglycosylase [Burkholderiales bacterium]|nr:MAG: monofunctional biosynthetic peptidoglycan transglycosylase [Burkholderiales bacterium]TAG76841.1 MAG: monofunctional biosynthetic peptidoglycan transglycosylase [Betaproteobacteria bacterium]